jgi:hypothetical protein
VRLTNTVESEMRERHSIFSPASDVQAEDVRKAVRCNLPLSVRGCEKFNVRSPDFVSLSSEVSSRQCGGIPGSPRPYGLDRRAADQTTVRAGF